MPQTEVGTGMEPNPVVKEGVVKNTTLSVALTPVSESFQGIPVRIVTVDGGDMIPVVDIARSLGMDRGNLSKSLKDDLFKNKQRIVRITTPKGAQKMVCITELGAVGLLYKIDAKHSTDEAIKKRILDFQEWATNLVNKKMQIQSKLTKDQGDNWSMVAIGHLNFAKQLARDNPDMDPGMCLAIGIRQAERATGMDLSAYKKLIPPASAVHQEEYLTATQIGHEIGRTAREVNRYLERWGYLYRGEDDVYYLTNMGAQYGRVFPGAFESGHCGYYIKWKRSIISAARMRENSPVRIRDDRP